MLETIKFYTNLFSQFPWHQSRIQEDTVEMFAILQGKNISIEESFFFYNKRLLSRLADPFLIAKHLCFAIKIVEPSVLPQVLTSWLGYIAEESFSRDYGAYGSFFAELVGVATCRRGTLDFIKVVFEGIYIFEEAIKRDLEAEVNNQGLLGFSHLRILVLLTRILEYCDLTETEIPSNFLCLFRFDKRPFPVSDGDPSSHPHKL